MSPDATPGWCSRCCLVTNFPDTLIQPLVSWFCKSSCSVETIWSAWFSTHSPTHSATGPVGSFLFSVSHNTCVCSLCTISQQAHVCGSPAFPILQPSWLSLFQIPSSPLLSFRTPYTVSSHVRWGWLISPARWRAQSWCFRLAEIEIFVVLFFKQIASFKIMKFLVVRWDKQIGPVLVSDCILWILTLPTVRPGYLRVGFTQQYFLPHPQPFYDFLWISHCSHPFLAWKYHDFFPPLFFLKGSWLWVPGIILMMMSTVFDVTGPWLWFCCWKWSTEKLGCLEGNVNPAPLKTESNPPWHQNRSPGNIRLSDFCFYQPSLQSPSSFSTLTNLSKTDLTLWRLQEDCWTRTKQKSELYVTKITAGDTWMEEVLGRPKKEYVCAHVCTPHRSVWTHPLIVYLKCTNRKKNLEKKSFKRRDKIGLCPSLQGAFSLPFPPSHYSSSLPLNKSFTRDGCRGA